jgi:AraC-like DNA-binding protein
MAAFIRGSSHFVCQAWRVECLDKYYRRGVLAGAEVSPRGADPERRLRQRLGQRTETTYGRLGYTNDGAGQTASSDLLQKMEEILAEYFDKEKSLSQGIPTVHYLSENLNMSPTYLSDMLRSLTGQNAQQHILPN